MNGEQIARMLAQSNQWETEKFAVDFDLIKFDWTNAWSKRDK